MPQSSTLDPFSCDMFINELDENIEYMLIKCPDKTHTLAGRIEIRKISKSRENELSPLRLNLIG